jgi:hypothetical protein
MERMRSAGDYGQLRMPIIDALRSATSINAHVLHMADKIGQVNMRPIRVTSLQLKVILLATYERSVACVSSMKVWNYLQITLKIAIISGRTMGSERAPRKR